MLPYKADLVWKTRSLLKEQEEGLARQATQSVELAAVSTIYLLEADRVRYVLANYLRTRLHKVRCRCGQRGAGDRMGAGASPASVACWCARPARLRFPSPNARCVCSFLVRARRFDAKCMGL